LWHQIYVLDGGKRLGGSFFGFRNAVCTPEQVGPEPRMVAWHDKPGAEQTVASLISDITVRHKLEECLDLPENSEHMIKYRPPVKVQKAYDQMEKSALVELSGGHVINAVSAGVVHMKLAQILSGAAYSESGNSAIIDTERYELTADLIAERDASVVFFLWTHQRDLIIEELKKRNIRYAVIDGNATDKERKAAVDGFQGGFLQTVLCHPQAAAHGLTLTRGKATIWPTPTSNLEWWIQGNRRIYRAGVKHRTETICLYAPDTLEEIMLERLRAKDETQTNLMGMLKQLQTVRRSRLEKSK
jgi:SNF2 family DNA or RNA helicase